MSAPSSRLSPPTAIIRNVDVFIDAINVAAANNEHSVTLPFLEGINDRTAVLLKARLLRFVQVVQQDRRRLNNNGPPLPPPQLPPPAPPPPAFRPRSLKELDVKELEEPTGKLPSLSCRREFAFYASYFSFKCLCSCRACFFSLLSLSLSLPPLTPYPAESVSALPLPLLLPLPPPAHLGSWQSGHAGLPAPPSRHQKARPRSSSSL